MRQKLYAVFPQPPSEISCIRDIGYCMDGCKLMYENGSPLWAVIFSRKSAKDTNNDFMTFPQFLSIIWKNMGSRPIYRGYGRGVCLVLCRENRKRGCKGSGCFSTGHTQTKKQDAQKVEIFPIKKKKYRKNFLLHSIYIEILTGIVYN